MCRLWRDNQGYLNYTDRTPDPLCDCRRAIKLTGPVTWVMVINWCPSREWTERGGERRWMGRPLWRPSSIKLLSAPSRWAQNTWRLNYWWAPIHKEKYKTQELGRFKYHLPEFPILDFTVYWTWYSNMSLTTTIHINAFRQSSLSLFWGEAKCPPAWAQTW